MTPLILAIQAAGLEGRDIGFRSNIAFGDSLKREAFGVTQPEAGRSPNYPIGEGWGAEHWSCFVPLGAPVPWGYRGTGLVFADGAPVMLAAVRHPDAIRVRHPSREGLLAGLVRLKDEGWLDVVYSMPP